jgi:hypothetical protein
MVFDANDTWASVAENAHGTVRPEQKLRRAKSHERCRIAGQEEMPAMPARRRKPDRARPERQADAESAWSNVSNAHRATLRATVDGFDRVVTPNAPSPASRPEAPGEKPQGRTDARHYRIARIRPGTNNRLTDSLGRPKRRSGTVRMLATPDKRSTAGESLKGPKPHERRIALACLRRCNARKAAVLAGASTSDPDDPYVRSPWRMVVRWR